MYIEWLESHFKQSSMKRKITVKTKSQILNLNKLKDQRELHIKWDSQLQIANLNVQSWQLALTQMTTNLDAAQANNGQSFLAA